MKEYKLHELKSSRILYNKKDPKMGFMIIGITLLLVVGLIITAGFVKKTEVVRSNGILTTNNKTYIMSETGGRIVKVHKANGDFVNEGDLIIELDKKQVQAQISSLNYKLEYLTNHIHNLNQFIIALDNFNCENLKFNNNPFSEGEFYLQYESLIKAVEKISTFKIDEHGVEVKKELDELINERKELIQQYLTQYYGRKGQYQYELSGVLGQKEAYELTLDSYNLYAKSSGYVNYSSGLSDSLVIGKNPIGTINEKLTKDNAIIELLISTNSINHIEKGYKVDVSVSGLSQVEYGVITGKVQSISTDSLVLEEGAFYKVIVIPDNIILNDINLVTGQATEVRIKYDELTYLQWILKKIGFFK